MTRTRDRIGPLDIVLTVICTALGVLLMYGNITDPDPGAAGPASNWAIPLFLLVTLPLLFRSVAPLAALGAVVAGLLIHSVAIGTVVRCGAVFPVVALLTFSAAARLDRRQSLYALGLSMLAFLILGAWEALGWGVLTVLVPLNLVAYGLGRVAYSRGQLAEQLRDRGEELRITRDERARLEVETDRAQLSGELEELLEARLGQLATLADAGAQTSDPAVATEMLVDIETGSRETLEQMRELVGVLRSDAGDAATAPQPTLTSLDALLVRSKGADARLTIEGSPRALPPAVELSAYRVTEQLLYALDDAPGVMVNVRFDDDALVLSVSGQARRRIQAGAAMERARERVALHSGSLSTIMNGGRAEVTASLPVYAAV